MYETYGGISRVHRHNDTEYMNELDLTEEDFQPLSEEESRAGLQALKERIARETGAVI